LAIAPPASDHEDWQRTDPLGIAARTLQGLQRAILPLVAVMVGSGGFRQGPLVALAIFAAILAGNVLFAWIGWRHHRYQLGADDIRVERGIVSRHSRAVPYDRIQDVSLHEAPLARLLGLVEVRFETGAGGKDELTLAYVSRDQGARLRDTVRARRGALPATGQEAPQPAEPTDRTLFAMDLPRLLTFGIFEFSLVVFAVLFGAVSQFDFLLPFDVWEPQGWLALLTGPAEWLAGMGLAVQVIGALFAAGSLALVGLVTGIVRTVLRDYGFRLDRTDKGLRRRHGLLTRSDMVMPVHRVQALTVTTGLMRRWIGGWHALRAVSLAQDDKAGSHVLVPFATMAEIDPVVAETGFVLPPADLAWHGTSPAYHASRALAVAVPLLAVGALLLAADPYIVEPEYQPLGIAILLAMIAAFQCARRYFLWRHDRFALDEGQLYVRRGWLAPRLDIAARVKAQSVELTQGPLGRSRGYATLRFGIAGGDLDLIGARLDDARAIAGGVLESVARLDFSRLPR
jgi:putative membrane protein